MDPAGRLTRGRAFRTAVASLKRAGVNSPALDAAVLLGHATGMPGPRALLERDAHLTAGQLDGFLALVERRCRAETVSRIIGHREFYSRSFRITESVLDPRPETELLAQKAISWLTSGKRGATAMEVGTGSGALAITVAAEVPGARVLATDISGDALSVAAANARTHGVDDRVRFVRMDLGAGLAPGRRFDLLVSNPPYISEAQYDRLSRDVREGDPPEALVAGPKGTEFFGPIAQLGGAVLNPGGRVMVEVGAGQAEEVSSLFRRSGLVDVFTDTDLGGIERVVVGTVDRA